MGQARPPIIIPDVLLMVAQVLQAHPFSLLQLCMIDKATYSLLHDLLYQHVELSSTEAIQAFCSVINSEEGLSAGKYVISLSIGEKDPIHNFPPSRLVSSLAPALQAALRRMPNLLNLNISATSAALSSTLNNLNPPFRLGSFSYYGNSTGPVVRFLMSQPKPTKLEMWSKPSYNAYETFQKLIPAEASFLPQLEQLSVPLDIVPHLVPLRPIETVVILDLGYWTPSNRHLEHLMKSTAPISSVCIVKSFVYCRHSWDPVIEQLNSTHLRAWLRCIKLEEFLF
ncbi:hypothetical protein BDV93DRAFT_527685, partial [Ceratobasidium sp. AG-I]